MHDVKRQTIIHVVNRTGAGLGQGPGQLMHEAIPIHDIVLRLSPQLAPNRSVWLEPDHRPLRTSRDGDVVRVTLPPVRVWETLVAR